MKHEHASFWRESFEKLWRMFCTFAKESFRPLAQCRFGRYPGNPASLIHATSQQKKQATVYFNHVLINTLRIC